MLKLTAAAAMRLALVAGLWAAQDTLATSQNQPELATLLIQKQAAPDLNTLTPMVRIISMAKP